MVCEIKQGLSDRRKYVDIFEFIDINIIDKYKSLYQPVVFIDSDQSSWKLCPKLKRPLQGNRTFGT